MLLKSLNSFIYIKHHPHIPGNFRRRSSLIKTGASSKYGSYVKFMEVRTVHQLYFAVQTIWENKTVEFLDTMICSVWIFLPQISYTCISENMVLKFYPKLSIGDILYRVAFLRENVLIIEDDGVKRTSFLLLTLERLSCYFSRQFHPWIIHHVQGNRRNDHQLKRLSFTK